MANNIRKLFNLAHILRSDSMRFNTHDANFEINSLLFVLGNFK